MEIVLCPMPLNSFMPQKEILSLGSTQMIANKIDKDQGFWKFGGSMETSNSALREHYMNYHQFDSGALSRSSTDESSVVSHESTQVFPEKIDEKENSRKGFWLFGVWIESNDSSLQDVGSTGSEKKVAFEDQERGKKRPFERLPDSEKPFKKRALSQDSGVVKMTKVLTDSDVNCSCRLLLDRKSDLIDQLLRHLNVSMERFEDTNHGVEVKVFDSDMRRETRLVLKRWATKSFVFNHGWKENFVNVIDLKKDDVIELTWDEAAGRLNFSVVKKAAPEEHGN